MNYFQIVYDVLDKWYKNFAAFTPKLAIGIIVFVLFYLLSFTLSKITVKTINKLFPKSKQHESAKALVNVFRFLFILAGSFISFEIMGLNGLVLKFIGSLGVAGVIAGVALKDLVSSMFSGILVGVDKSFKIGDYVTIDGVSGTVEEIGFLTTKVIADDGKKYFVPNQLIFSAPFVNVSASENRRISLNFEVPNSEDLTKIEEIIQTELTNIAGISNPQEAQIIILKQSLGVYYLEIRFWLQKGNNLLSVQSNAYKQIKSKLDAHGISQINPLQNLTGSS